MGRQPANTVQISSGRIRIVVGLICVAALVLRIAYRVHMGSDDFWQNGYSFFYDIARNIAAGKGLWSESGGWAMRPPVYPYFLALAALAGGHYLLIVVPQAFFGAGTVLCAFLIGRLLFNERCGVIAAALTAIYPYYVVHDTALQETSMMTFFAAFSVYLLLLAKSGSSITQWFAVGAVLCITVLVRTTMLPFVMAALVWIVFFGDGSRVLNLQRVTLIFLVFALGLGSWLERNELVVGRPVLTSEAGFQLWMAHNPQTFSRYPRESIDRSTDVALQALSPSDRSTMDSLSKDELGRNDWFLEKGLAHLRQYPSEAVFDAARKVEAGFSWTFNPARDHLVQLVYIVSYAPISLLGIIGMVLTMRNWRQNGFIYLQFLTFIFVAGIFWAHTNHRTYLDVYLIVFSAAVLDRVWTLIRPERGHARFAVNFAK